MKVTVARFCAIMIATLLLGVASPACADFFGDVLKPFVSGTESYDSNVYRVKNREQLEAFTGSESMSDFSTVISLGTDVHYEISHQKLDLTLLHDFMRYSEHTNLDTDRDLIRGALSLSLLDKFRLKVDGSYEDYPQPRTDFRNKELNKVTRWSTGGTASYEMPSGVGFEGGYSRTETGYSLSEYREREYTVDHFSGNVTYRLSPMTKLYAGYHREEIDYIHSESAEDDFSSEADSVRAGMEIAKAAKTTLSGYVGYVSRSHRHQKDRDFDGVIGRLASTYKATARISVMLDWQRQIYEETYAEWIYSITDAVGTAIAYQVTPRIKVVGTGRVQWKEFEKAPPEEEPTPPEEPAVQRRARSDVIYEAGANVEWQIYRRLFLTLAYQYSARESNIGFYEFTDHTASVTLACRY